MSNITSPPPGSDSFAFPSPPILPTAFGSRVPPLLINCTAPTEKQLADLQRKMAEDPASWHTMLLQNPPPHITYQPIAARLMVFNPTLDECIIGGGPAPTLLKRYQSWAAENPAAIVAVDSLRLELDQRCLAFFYYEMPDAPLVSESDS